LELFTDLGGLENIFRNKFFNCPIFLGETIAIREHLKEAKKTDSEILSPSGVKTPA
jgi:hypothetical protein